MIKAIQLIDSLHAGGAERVAVSYANALKPEILAYHLCTTREEGDLKEQLNEGVGYLFLKKRSALDILAVVRLVRYCKNNQINIIHAHGSSFLTAVLAHFFLGSTKVVWHNHYGNIQAMGRLYLGVLRWCSRYFSAILTVNEQLKTWSESYLRCSVVAYFKNGVPILDNDKVIPVDLEGDPNLRILLMANFREEKDHLNAIEAFSKVKRAIPEATLHLIGRHTDLSILKEVNARIEKYELAAAVFLHGSKQNVNGFMRACRLGLLSSKAEGLPMALLEYGGMGMIVVSTAVGQCPSVLGNDGYLVPPENPTALAEALIKALKEDNANMAAAFHERVISEYSIRAIIPKLVQYYESVR